MKKLLFFVLLTIALTFLSLELWDQTLSVWFSQPEQLPLKKGAREITDIGLGDYWFAVAILTYSWLRLIRPRLSKKPLTPREGHFKNWSGRLFFSLLASGILVQLLKHLIGRQRPHLTNGLETHVFQPLTTNWHFHSLPSGHTQVLFTVATSIALAWPRFSILSYSVFFALSFTRVMTLQHFLSDVIAGVLVGYLGTRWVWHYCDRKGVLK